MCSYLTVPTDVAGSAKGPNGWFSVTSAQVYFDHPFHAPFDHTLNIDFLDPSRGPGARVAVELSAESARRLIHSIQEALAAAGLGVRSWCSSSSARTASRSSPASHGQAGGLPSTASNASATQSPSS